MNDWLRSSRKEKGERRAEADSNRGPSAYQPDALPLGQTGSQQYAGKDREDTQRLQEDSDKIVQRLERLEQKLSSLDVDSRRCNLKFLGVREPTRDNYRANVNVIVDALNDECSSSRTWEHSDIQTAHRIGALVSRFGEAQARQTTQWGEAQTIQTTQWGQTDDAVG